ncbi:MAG TPA: PEP-CTERM sorting domain-containing protein [Myxococcota bacterium]|nr:PEP-CTERM sorting domain-containing protein [Myxococcota bacterium]
MRRMMISASVFACALAICGSGAQAVTLPFSEEFATDVSGWENNANAPLTWVASGGPDGSSFAQASFNYFGFSNPFGGGPVIFRASDSDNASGDAFVGDWLAAGVASVSAWVYQDTGVDLTYFLRVATAFNFPGAVIANPQTVQSGEWTLLTWAIDPTSALCTGETVTCAQALATVGNFQIGTSAPASLTSLDQAFTFGVDGVSLSAVPEPAALALLGAGAIGLIGMGRRR